MQDLIFIAATAGYGFSLNLNFIAVPLILQFFIETLVHSWGWATHLATARHQALLLASAKERWQLDPRIVTPHLVTRRGDVRDTGMAPSGPSPRRFL